MIQRPRQSFHLSLSYNQYQLNGSNLQDLTIEEYKVLKELGRGSFGKVYKAIDERGKYFALKLLDKKQAREEKSLRTKEIRQKLIESQPKLMQQCSSPNVIKCFDIYENEDLKILIMQYCNGVSLTDELKQRKRFTEREAVQILRHIINGVAELHRNSIVHRDLKTDNIMKHDGVYKIIDFGFSKKLQLSYEDESSKNTILGTPTNMAPQVVYRKNYGLKADIWSIGIIFFQMIFGATPYDLSTAGSFFKNIEKTFARIEPIFYRDANLSSQGQDFLRRVLKINPDERISWREMIEHPLTKIKDCQPLTSRFIERYDMVEPQVPKQLSEGSLVDRYDIVEPLASKLVVAEPFVQRQKVKVESLVHNQMAEVEPIAQRLIVEAQPLAKRSLVQVDPQISNQPIELEKYEITEYQRQKQQAEGSLAEKRLSQLTIRSLLKNSQIKPALSIIQTKLQEQPKFIKSSQNESKDDKPKKQRFDLDRLIQLEKQAQVKRKQLDEQEQLKRELAQQKPSIPMYPQQSQIRSQTFSKNQPKQPRAYSEIENSIIQQQNPQYRKCLVYHLECLKTQLIYEKIIEPIQSRSLLDFGQRESIQFMYLLISRCFKNLSPLKQMMKNSKNLHSSFNNLNLQIQRLYYNVAIKFKQYDERLLQLENKLFQMAKDFFSKIFSSDQQQRKNKMIGGVEIQQFTHENHIKQFGDFIKAEQIEFTSQYIQQILPKLLEIGSYTSKIKRYLQFYTPIMNITLESLGDQTFSDYVERIIS